jgi:hypothetical protein
VAEYFLSHQWMFIRHIINQQGGAFYHSPPTAARAGRLELKPALSS